MFVLYTFPNGFCMDNNNSGEKHRSSTIITSKRVNVKGFFVSLLKRGGRFLFWSLISSRRL
jgi:hypothetical protein